MFSKLQSELDHFNKERQILEKDLMEKILKNLENKTHDPVMVIFGKNWHEGCDWNSCI